MFTPEKSSFDLWCTCSHVFSLWSKQNVCAALMSAHHRYLYKVICSQHTTPKPHNIYANLPIKYQCSYSKQQHYCLFNRDTIFHMYSEGVWLRLSRNCAVRFSFCCCSIRSEHFSPWGTPCCRKDSNLWVGVTVQEVWAHAWNMLKSTEILLDMLCCCHLVS